MPRRTDTLASTVSVTKPVSVSLDITLPLTAADHAFNPTVTPILTALSANKASSSASNALSLSTVSSNSQQASVCALTASTRTPIRLAFPVLQAVEFANQPPTVLLVLPFQLPLEAEHATAPTKLTSPFHPMVFVIVLLAVLTV
jgi:hypothetical protein